MFIGFRIEIVSRIMPQNTVSDLVKDYNKDGYAKILDPQTNAKIVAKRIGELLVARGEKENRKKIESATNFSLVAPIDKKSEAERITQIINVLGNGRLIRERVKLFYDRKSALNGIPELQALVDAMDKLHKIAPGIIKGGWYYAPEIIYDEEDM